MKTGAIVSNADNHVISRPISNGNRMSLHVIASGMLGTTFEYYDFVVYGTIAAIVFNELFFPSASAGFGMLLSLATFAIGFLARPLGAAFFGHLGDRIGRRKTLIFTLVVMGGATVLIGFLPTYSSIGVWAPILLVILRTVQGAAMGGEWGGAVLLIGEYTNNAKRGYSTSLAQLGSPAGLLLANGVVLSVIAFTTKEQFHAWGWRIPFLLSFILVLLGLYTRTNVDETPVFKEMQSVKAVESSPVRETFRSHGRRLLLAIGATAISFAGYYMFTTMGLAYLSLKHIPSTYGLYGTVIGAAISLPTMVLSGIASDRFGRRPLYLLSTVLMAAWALVFFHLLDTGSPVLVATSIGVGVVSWSILWGVQGAFLPEMFPANVRYSAISLAYQIAGALVGLLPVSALALYQRFGTSLVLALVTVVIAAISAVAVFFCPETYRSE